MIHPLRDPPAKSVVPITPSCCAGCALDYACHILLGDQARSSRGIVLDASRMFWVHRVELQRNDYCAYVLLGIRL